MGERETSRKTSFQIGDFILSINGERLHKSKSKSNCDEWGKLLHTSAACSVQIYRQAASVPPKSTTSSTCRPSIARKEPLPSEDGEEIQEVYCSNSNSPSSEDAKIVGLAMNLVPMEDQIEYLEAMQKCPHLVASESPASAFLRATNNNAFNAAKKLAFYWKMRKRCVGPYKAFLPMSLEGAMVDDAEYIGRGHRVIGQDKHGRPVLSIERKYILQAPLDNRLRCMFYHFHHLSHIPAAQEKGYIGLQNRHVSTEGLFNISYLKCLSFY